MMKKIMKFTRAGKYLGDVQHEKPIGDEVLVCQYDKPDTGCYYPYKRDEYPTHGEMRWDTDDNKYKTCKHNFLGDLFPFNDIEKAGKLVVQVLEAA